MNGQTIILGRNRGIAHRLVSAAPHGALLRITKPRRSDDQNAKMWACLSDISRQAEHSGQRHSADVWKALFMHACEHEVRFVMGLNGEPFPTGFRSSQLNKGQMADLLTFIIQWGDEGGIRWSNEGAQ